MTSPLVPTYKGFVGSNLDALLIIEASLNNELPLVQRRPVERERGDLIKSGSVFVFVEKSSEIKRWTDGIAWSASRILGRFLIYRALDKFSEKGEKRKGRKSAKCKDLAVKVEDKSVNLGYVDKYLGFNDRFSYGQDMQFSQHKENLRPHKSLEYPSTDLKPHSLSNLAYGSFHGKITEISSTHHLQKQNPSSHKLGSLSVGCNSNPLNSNALWPANSVGYVPSNNQATASGDMENTPNQANTQGGFIVDEALIKKTISLTIYSDSSDSGDDEDKQTVHLISYFSAHDVLTGKILRPTQTDLKNVTISSRVWQALKRSSLGGKFPLENEANFFLDCNYQLQNMSILKCPNPEVKRVINRRTNSASLTETYGIGPGDYNRPMISQEPHAIDISHRNMVQLMDGTKSFHVPPAMNQIGTLEYPSMNKASSRRDHTNRNFKKRRVFHELDPRLPYTDVSLHYPETLIDQGFYSFPNSDLRGQNSSASSSRFSQYTLYSPDSKASTLGALSLAHSTGSIEKPEGNVSPTMMGTAGPKFEVPACVGSSLPMYTDSTYISEPGSPNQYNTTLNQSHVHGNQGFFQTSKPSVGQHHDLGNSQNVRQNHPQEINQNHNSSSVSQFYSARSIPSMDSSQSSSSTTESFPPHNRNLTNSASEQTLSSGSLNINSSGFGTTEQVLASLDRRYYSCKDSKDELTSPKYDPLVTNLGITSVSNAPKPNIHTDDGDYFQSGKTF